MKAGSGTRAEAAVIVVNYRSSHLLEQALAGAEAANAIVVVVDNWSDSTERTRVDSLARRHGWAAVLPSSNLGFGAGVNLGVNRALELGATSLILLNPDAVLPQSSALLLWEVAESRPSSLVAPLILGVDGTIESIGFDLYMDTGRHRSVARRGDLPGARRKMWLSGACLALGSELWCELGGFSEEYFLYWEDVEFSMRAAEHGADLVVLDFASVTHMQGATHGKGRQSAGEAKSSIYYFYNCRNRLLFAARNLSEPDIRRWRRSAMREGWKIMLQGGRRQLARPWRCAVPAFAGTLAGLWLSSGVRRRSAGAGALGPLIDEGIAASSVARVDRMGPGS